jgi:hypothetical protein
VLHAQRAWYHPANPERFAANLSKKAQNEKILFLKGKSYVSTASFAIT